jgi:hypothetical protein
VILMAKPSVRTSASSKLSRVRNESFCHMRFIHHRRGGSSSRAALTDKKRGYLIEPYSNLALDA